MEKELLYTLLPASLVRPVMNAIRNARRSSRTRGILFTIDVLEAFRRHDSTPAAPSQTQEDTMSDNSPEQSGYELLSVIVNHGSADQVMDRGQKRRRHGRHGHPRARNGPSGRRLLLRHHHRAGKGLVMILAPKDKSARIMESVKAEFKDAEPGSGIAFRTAVESFDMLGSSRR